VAHRHDHNLLQTYSQMLLSRGVEGFITVDTSLRDAPSLPTVAVAGHRPLENVTNVILDHRKAALLGLEHLRGLGHKQIAILKGQAESSDSQVRWESICEVAQELGIEINPQRVVQLQGVDSTPELGYPFGKELLARRVPFTALFAYNDISAIGAMRALQEAGLRVPEDVSVVGFDDIASAMFCRPNLTTIRQPLKKMGRIAAETLLDRIEGNGEFTAEIAVEPELVIRKSTGRVPQHAFHIAK
jgi:LacI family transcriptional regulator